MWPSGQKHGEWQIVNAYEIPANTTDANLASLAFLVNRFAAGPWAAPLRIHRSVWACFPLIANVGARSTQSLDGEWHYVESESF